MDPEELYLEELQRRQEKKPVPTGLWNAIENVGKGLSRDVPRFANWLFKDAVVDTAKGLYSLPKRLEDATRVWNETGVYDPAPFVEAATLGIGGGAFGAAARSGEVVLGAGRPRRLPPRPVWDESIPPPPRGHNMPPAEFALEAPAVEAAAPAAEAATPAARSWWQDLPRAQPAAKSTDIPSIRGLPVADAVAIARTQPHLVEAGDQSEGKYVGGPRDLTSKAGLNARRRWFDNYIAADPRGGDWYDRYRAAMAEVTGDKPSFNEWMSRQEGQWSAGVDPGSEFHFAIKENNASIAGEPVKAARPAQHEAHEKALREKNPAFYLRGDKTGPYGDLINPDRPRTVVPGATGVNDFRHGENWGFPREEQTSFTPAQHKFLDMETALAVDRANRSNLDGRSNWTGEQLQAAPWVRQKALDIQERGGKDAEGNFKLSYEDAFQRANKTIGDFFPRHTAYATYEQQPGAYTNHLPQSVEADAAARREYFDDPRSRWGTAAGGRDAIYSGLGVEGTGNYMRVRPTEEMQGFYKTPGGIETNPGEVARPLVTFNVPKGKEFIGPRPEFEPFKEITGHDKKILNAGEAVRALIDAQQAGAWHKTWFGGPTNQSNSLVFARPGRGISDPQELKAIQDKLSQHGLGDVVDTASGGITSTNFWPKPDGGKAFDQAVRSGELKQFGEPIRTRVDSDIIDYSDAWKNPGKGEATQKMLDYVNATPQLRDAFNRNGDIAERALARMGRDKDWTSRWGAPREDIQNLRKIIGAGAGWVDRLEAAIRQGAILPAVGAAFFAAAMAKGGAAAKPGNEGS